MDDFDGYSGPDAPQEYDDFTGDVNPDAPGGINEPMGGTDPGLPGDDLIFLAMMDDEESRRPGNRSAGGCGGCVLPMVLPAAGLLLAGCLAALLR